MMHDISFDDWSGAPVDMFVSVNPIYTDLRRGLVKYRQRWGDLPQIPVPAGPTLKPGIDRRAGRRAARRGSGLPAGDSYDAALAAAGQGIPGRPRPQGRRHRRRRDDRGAEPRRRIL